MNHIEAMKQALEALRDYRRSDDDRVSVAMGILQEALAEQPAQQQEPVAWITQNGKGWLRWHKPEDNNTDSVPLYTSPPASKPWVGLTQEDMYEIGEFKNTHGYVPTGFKRLAAAIEAKLREKNNGTR